jgi:hypothetical protein
MKKNSSSKRVIKLDPAPLEQGFTIEFSSLLKNAPQLFHLAVKEAEAIAWQTPFPQLVLPGLLEEKLEKADRWHRRQHSLRKPAEGETSFAA